MNTRSRLRSTALATLALTAGLFGSACSSSGGRLEAIDRPVSTQTSVEAPGTSTARQDKPTSTTSVAPADEVFVIRSTTEVELHEQPDASSPARRLAATTEFGSARALLITDQQEGWAQVLVPGRPTGARGWLNVKETPGIELRPVTTRIEVDLAARTLTLVDKGQVVLSTPVAVGSAEYPTPTGLFSVTDKLQDPNPNGAYGPFALGLSGYSEVLTEFAGGEGQIGIHGTNAPDSIGQAVSHGCIRVPNDVITQLNEVLPLGTPVVIR